MVVLFMVVAAGGPVSATDAVQPAQKPPVNTWPKIAYNEANSGDSPDPLISTANASRLGVSWMAPTGTTDYSSPVVQWNAQLGETLIYQGNENGYLTAFNQANGQTVWSDNLGSAIRDTPLVEGAYVWVADTFSPSLYKIDAATGQVECSTPMVSTDNGSPTIGAGPGGALTVYIAVNDLGTANGPLYAVNEADCSVDWTYSTFDGNDAAGSWDPLAYADDANGTPLVLLGTSDPDSSVYAVNAATGKQVWSFQTLVNPTFSDDDVGAGVSVTAPGVNGFADGVAYVPGKDGWMYALDLTTGDLIWDFNFGKAFNVGPEYSRATPAVVGDSVIFGGTMGVASLNATTGAVNWVSPAAGGGEVLSAAAVVGPAGQRVVAVTSISGYLSVFSAASGALLYSYPLGGFSVASVSDVDGNLLANSSDGFLYDFAVGGANSGSPTTRVTKPANGSTNANSKGTITISGTASGGPIAAVDVAVQEDGSLGPWWNGNAGAFTPGYDNNLAALRAPGADTTTWSLQIPVPTAGGTYTVHASAIGTDGLADLTADEAAPSPSQASFAVTYLKSAPHLVATQGAYVAPGTPVTISGGGFGDDEQVALSVNGETLATGTTGSNGGLPAVAVPIPAAASFGSTSLVATGETSGRTTSIPIDISNEWDQAGYDSLNTAAEPNDTVLRDHVAPVSSTYLAQAWSYPSGAAIETSATIEHGVLYFANNAGDVTALGIHQSNPLWTYQAASPVDSTPLAANGLVIFGTSGGEVEALSTTNGSVVWSFDAGSPVDAPPAESGTLLVIGTTGGTLYGVDSTTGAIEWQDTVPGPVEGAAAIDPAQGVVAVGAGNTVTALTTQGAPLWTYVTGGPVTADPTIDDGAVMVGSQDGHVYRLGETTGAVGWNFNAQSPISVGGSLNVLNGTQYVVGGQDGEVYFLGESNGRAVKQFDAKGPVAGIASSPGFTVVTTSSGAALAYKYTGGASWQYNAPAGFASAAAIVNGVVYLTGLDQTVRAFTIPGRPIP